MTIQKIAKSMMDLAVMRGEVVEYTASYRSVMNLRSECYKLRGASRSLGLTTYDNLSFNTRVDGDNLLTLSMEKK